MIMTAVTIAETARGILRRDGTIIDVLEPGRHSWFDPRGQLHVETLDVRQPLVNTELANVLERNHPELVEGRIAIVRPGRNELALVSVDGAPYAVVLHGVMRAFWTPLRKIDVETVNLREADRIEPREAERWFGLAGTNIFRTQVEATDFGLLFENGQLVGRLAPGRHAFWAVDRKLRVEHFDRRPTVIDVIAQEILTEDRVTVRINLTAAVRITDPETLVSKVQDVWAHMHKLVQLAVRDAVGGRTLDALLRERADVDTGLAAQVRKRVEGLGLEVGEVRIKDIILPGDMRDLLNQVVEAEKAAEANLIRRREETAATRSLLNTARLMENHPTLMRLKELEALERLTDKVGRIDVHQTAKGAGLPALLDTLMGETTAKTAD